jgi:hypothetical protein
MNNILHTTEPPTPEEIAGRAYALWLRDCRVDGRDVEHWLQAEYELLAEREAALPAKRLSRKREKKAARPA